MVYYLKTVDKQGVSAQYTYDSLRSAYVAYETAVHDNAIIRATLWVNGLAVPLAEFDRTKVIRSDDQNIVYNIIN